MPEVNSYHIVSGHSILFALPWLVVLGSQTHGFHLCVSHDVSVRLLPQVGLVDWVLVSRLEDEKWIGVHLVATRCASGFWGFLSPLVSFRTRLAFSVSSIFFNRLLEAARQSSLAGGVNG